MDGKEKEKNSYILSGYILDISTNENGYTVKATLSPKIRKNHKRYLSNETNQLFLQRQNYTGSSNTIIDFMKDIK